MKKILLWLSMLILIISMIAGLSLVGCKKDAVVSESKEVSKSEEVTKTQKDESAKTEKKEPIPGVDRPIKILGMVHNMDIEFHYEIAAGYKIIPEGVNAEIFVEDPHGSVEQQISILESYMTQDIDAVVMYPIDSKALEPIVAELKEKGIYIITEGNHVEGEDRGMVTDERDGGLLGGNLFVDWWPKNRPGVTPNILVLDIPAVAEPQKKPDAFVEVVTEKMPEAVIVAQQNCDGSAELGLTVTEATLQAHPELNAIMGVCDTAVVGALAAAENAGRKDINVIGAGGEVSALKGLSEPLNPEGGGWAFTIAYARCPAEIGARMTEAACGLVMGKDVPMDIVDFGFLGLTRDNLQDYINSLAEWRQRAGLTALDL